jgi:glycosyltransferase involved in cell wall biosynthesis
MSNSTYPLISIVVAVYNGATTLQHCFDSIAQQSYPYKELIVIDGGSTDGTVDLLKSNQQHISYWVSEPDKGIYDAWNKALTKVNGEWVAFLGADDIFLPNALQGYADYLLAHQNQTFDYVSSKVNLVKGNQFIRTIGKPWCWHDFRRYMNVAHVGSLHSKLLYERIGVYNTRYKICADYELLLRPRASLRTGFLNQVTVNMNIGGASDSIAALHEMERAKIISGGRNALLAKIENRLAIFRMHIRKRIWY